VVSMLLLETEEMNTGLCSLMDLLHLCKSSHCITSLGSTIFCSHDSISSMCTKVMDPKTERHETSL